MTQRKQWGAVVGTLALVAALVGCGAASSGAPAPHPTPGASAASVAPRPTLTRWTAAGAIPAGDQIIAGYPGAHHLWFLVQIPANANHPSGYIGYEASANPLGLTRVTPEVYTPAPYVGDYANFGRTTAGRWWIAFGQQHSSSPESTLATATWQPGAAHWTTLPVLTVPSPPNAQWGGPALTVLTGDRGHGWLVSTYRDKSPVGITPILGQTLVYHLGASGWTEIHAFPVSHNLGGYITWATTGPAGTVFVCPASLGNPVLLSASGAVLSTWSLPHNLMASLSSNSGLGTRPTVQMSSNGTVYLVNSVNGQLWAWTQQGGAQSLIQPGTSLAGTELRWMGTFRGHPVLKTVSANDSTYVALVYHAGVWTSVPALLRPYSTSDGTSATRAAWSNGHPLWLWSAGQNTGRHLYVRKAPAGV
jgi:hypothetical protein